jgi:hypothetical protein
MAIVFPHTALSKPFLGCRLKAREITNTKLPQPISARQSKDILGQIA